MKPTTRLGSGSVKEIKNHAFFSTVDWDKVEKKDVIPPFRPLVLSADDTRNIDKVFLNETVKDTPVEGGMSENTKAKNYFNDFTYTKENEMEKMRQTNMAKEAILKYREEGEALLERN